MKERMEKTDQSEINFVLREEPQSRGIDGWNRSNECHKVNLTAT